MRRLGKLVIMTDKEFTARARDNTNALAKLFLARNNAVADAANCAEEVHRIEANRRAERKAAFTAGKWHSAGGYAKALMMARKDVSQARRLLVRWRPIVEALETIPGQFTNDC